MRIARIFLLLALALLTLFGVPWLVLVMFPAWPTPMFVLGTALFAIGPLVLPAAMFLGHRPRPMDRAALVGDALLGIVWVLFSWSVMSLLARVGLLLCGVDNP
ncbi:MAG: metallophosphoesterase, partial [Pseudonocardiaceae bacterium]